MSKVVLREGDMVYVQENPNRIKVELCVDWLQLARQKALLIDLADAHPLLQGLVEMIDYIQDEGADAELPVVFGYTAADWAEQEAAQ